MHRIPDPHHVNRAERVAPVVFYQFIDPRTEPFPRLGRVRRPAQLHNEQRDTHVLLDGNWEFLEVLLRGAFAVQELAFLARK